MTLASFVYPMVFTPTDTFKLAFHLPLRLRIEGYSRIPSSAPNWISQFFSLIYSEYDTHISQYLELIKRIAIFMRSYDGLGEYINMASVDNFLKIKFGEQKAVVKTIQQFVFQSAWKISFVILGVDQSVSYFVYDRVGVYINYMNCWHLYWRNPIQLS